MNPTANAYEPTFLGVKIIQPYDNYTHLSTLTLGETNHITEYHNDHRMLDLNTCKFETYAVTGEPKNWKGNGLQVKTSSSWQYFFMTVKIMKTFIEPFLPRKVEYLFHLTLQNSHFSHLTLKRPSITPNSGFFQTRFDFT